MTRAYSTRLLRGVCLLLLSLLASRPLISRTIAVGQGEDLQTAIERAGDGDTLHIAAGKYSAVPLPFVESECGNCTEARTVVHATRGFLIQGKRLTLAGAGDSNTILVTGAGYGVLFLDSHGSTLQDLQVTGGKRDSSGAATDAAVVVKRSNVLIRNCCFLRNSDYFDSIVVGIGGVVIRESSEARISGCRITGNSWDGIALYRGAVATITDCIIDSGRGAGIGVTWDAAAICLRNRISHYWKGIGSFGTSTVLARNNTACENLGWGLIASGESTMIAENNTVVRNGNCGIAVWNSGTRGRIVNNISAFNGWRKEWVCPCVGFWNQEGDTSGWEIRNNLLWGNHAADIQGQDSSGFLFADPQFADSVLFTLKSGSPAARSGAPALGNPDGSRSDLGVGGGPAVRVLESGKEQIH